MSPKIKLLAVLIILILVGIIVVVFNTSYNTTKEIPDSNEVRVLKTSFSHSVGNGIVPNEKYIGINTHNKTYVILDTVGIDALSIVESYENTILFNKCNARCNGIYKIDLSTATKIDDETYYLSSNKFIDISETDKVLKYEKYLFVVTSKEVSKYDLSNNMKESLYVFKEGETSGYVSGNDGQSIMPEVKIEGNTLFFSVYQNIIKSDDPFNNKQKAPLYNHSVLIK